MQETYIEYHTNTTIRSDLKKYATVKSKTSILRNKIGVFGHLQTFLTKSEELIWGSCQGHETKGYKSIWTLMPAQDPINIGEERYPVSVGKRQNKTQFAYTFLPSNKFCQAWSHGPPFTTNCLKIIENSSQRNSIGWMRWFSFSFLFSWSNLSQHWYPDLTNR